jgi:hypothetical protein
MASLRSAINEKCKDCIYDPRSGLGTWREQVARCSVYLCPLWEIRPLPTSGPMAAPPVAKKDHLDWLRQIEASEKHLLEA